MCVCVICTTTTGLNVNTRKKDLNSRVIIQIKSGRPKSCEVFYET